MQLKSISLLFLSILFSSSVSFASINYDNPVWKDISERSRGETLLLPVAMESFYRFMMDLEPRNEVESQIVSFFREHPEYISKIKKAYAGLSDAGEEGRDKLGAFTLVKQSQFSLPLIQKIAETNVSVTLDDLMFSQEKTSTLNFPIALHMFRIDVIEEYDDVMNDSLYVYSVMTDGTVTWGKVTDIYPSIDEGQSVMLSAVDRAIYPPVGISSKIPNTHLIVDYGIMESDGDDIVAMQELSKDLVTLAAEVLKLVYPEYSPLTDVLARETQTLLATIIALNSDDRMAVGTVNLPNDQISSLLSGVSSTEFFKEHRGKHFEFPYKSKWHYRLGFRLIKG